jgi:hypothetical protein
MEVGSRAGRRVGTADVILVRTGPTLHDSNVHGKPHSVIVRLDPSPPISAFLDRSGGCRRSLPVRFRDLQQLGVCELETKPGAGELKADDGDPMEESGSETNGHAASMTPVRSTNTGNDARKCSTKTVQIRLCASNLPRRRRGLRSVVPSTFCAVTSLALEPMKEHSRTSSSSTFQLKPVVSGVEGDVVGATGDHGRFSGIRQSIGGGSGGIATGMEGHVWGKTEVLKSLNPQWTTCIYREWQEGTELYFYVHVLASEDDDEDEEDYRDQGDGIDNGGSSEGHHGNAASVNCYLEERSRTSLRSLNFEASLGAAAMEVSDILGTEHGTRVKRLRKGGCIYCRVEVARVPLQYRCALELSVALYKPSKSFLWFEISKTAAASKNDSITTWLVVYRSSMVIVTSTSLPSPLAWDAAELDLGTLCNGDLDKPLRISIHKKGRGAASVLVGVTETTLRHLVRLADPNPRTEMDLPGDLLRPNELFLQSGVTTQLQRVGKVQVLRARVSKEASAEEDGHDSSVQKPLDCSLFPSTLPHHQAPQLADFVDNQRPQTPLATPVVFPLSPQGTLDSSLFGKSFHDYIRQGLVLDVCMAIDFTSSNGAPNLPHSLHHQSVEGYNDYEETLLAIGSAMGPYSSKEYCVWGFGAKFPPDTTVRHLFQCGQQPKVVGTQGVLDAYHSVFRSDFIMSGPTVMLQVLQAAAIQAKKQHSHMANTLPTPDLRYTVLLIVTDGLADEFEETQRKLAVYSSMPLSVVVVGVGRSTDFARMHQLCDSLVGGGMRSNATFVEFRSHQHDPASLATFALQRVPTQVCEYFYRRGF